MACFLRFFYTILMIAASNYSMKKSPKKGLFLE